MKRVLFLLLVALAAGLLSPLAAHADGLVIVTHPRGAGRSSYLCVVYHHVEVTIEDQVATTRIDQVFRNDSDLTVEGTYIFPLPEEAAIERFVMYVDGKPLEGEVLDREQARSIYEAIVRSNRDPALLEYVGQDTFQASIFPIAPGEEKRVQIEYSQVLPMEQGLVRYVYPLSTERFSTQPIEDVAITIRLSSREPLRAVYSPSHEVSLYREDNHHATIGYEDRAVLPDQDFVLYYTSSSEDFGLNLLTYNVEDEDGFFLLLVAPPMEVEDQEIVAKDVIFVLDTSGSMHGEKIEQAKGALGFVLEHLNPADRFGIVVFDTAVSLYHSELLPAAERTAAVNYVRGLSASGSTDIHGALMRALDLAEPDSGRPQVILFLTDGLPTLGLTEPADILENVRWRSSTAIRLFPFGVGYDVNSALLDDLAQGNHGASDYILPGENLEERVSSFYAKVNSPMLVDLSLDFGGITVESVYPSPLPDLFLGSQLILTGRYRGTGAATITLRGTVNGEQRVYRYEDMIFPEKDSRQDFIPRLWASRKIGYLMREMRLHGENREIADEIIDLSVRYGIITRHTSFLVDETDRALTAEGQAGLALHFADGLRNIAPSGADAVTFSVDTWGLSHRDIVYSGSRPPGLRQVGDRAFLLVDGVWIDTTYTEGDPTTPLTFAGDSYFDLLAARPEWGQYLSVGARAIVVLDGVAYEVVTEASPPVTPPPPRPTSTPRPPIVDPGAADETPLPWSWIVLVGGGLVGLVGAAGLALLRRGRA